MTWRQLWASPLAPVLGVAMGAAVVLLSTAVALDLATGTGPGRPNVTRTRAPSATMPAMAGGPIIYNEWTVG